MDSTTATPNRRVRSLLDTAEKHGWTTEHPTPEVATWLIYPRNVVSDDGFVVYGLPNNGARVLRASTYKSVTQKAAVAAIESHHVEPKTEETPSLDDIIQSAIDLINSSRRREPSIDDVHHTSRIVSQDDHELVVETEFSIPEGLPEREKSEFCEGALLCATTVARLMKDTIDMSASLIPPEVRETAAIAPPMAAHVYLQLANQLRDPKTLRMALKGFADPGAARLRGAQMVCSSLNGVWTAFADGLFRLDPELGAPVSEFLDGLHEHADFIRTSADESFGPFVTASDDDFESLLS